MNEIIFPINMYDPTRNYKQHKNEFDDAIFNVLNKGNFIMGEEVIELENRLATYVNVRHCISCANGTDALLIELLALNIKIDDEIITTPHTWISTSEVISLLGAKPIFVDIDKNFNLDISQIENKITTKTKVILPVSLYGLMPDYEKINEIAKKYDISVIEDGAQSFGAKRNDYKSCSCKFTTIATTSFFPTKPLGCFGDGGAIFTNNDELGLKIKAIKSHGGLERFKHKYIGVNSRLDTIQASILLVKMKYFDECLQNRNNVANIYLEKLKDIQNIVLPVVTHNCYHAWAQFSILVKNKNKRDHVFAKLKELNINCSIFYPVPLHYQECFSYMNYKIGDFPVAEDICDRIINLPLYAELTNEEQLYICNCFINAL
jgi:UDP-2-acetamido-2-deoxy-ribo-hexuluronate aminotransferase